MDVSKNRGGLPPKMDGENNGSKPYEQMDDLGGIPPHYFWVQHPYDIPPLAKSWVINPHITHL